MQAGIVITGAAGFIGRNVVAELNRRGRTDLLLVDSLGSDERWKNLLGLEYEDLLSPAAFIDSVRTGKAAVPQTIIHLGACSATTERNADYLLENNYRYTRTLCEWSLKHGTRFVYASSAATYGDGSQGYDDADTVTPTLRPLNMYGYSKHMFDLWALRHGLLKKIAGIKYFNVFGPHEDHKEDMRSVVVKSFEQIAARGYVELFKSYKPGWSDGEQQRDFVYVKDAVDVTLYLADYPHASGLFNCGTGQARSWKELALAAFNAMGKKPDIRFIEMPETLRGKYQYFTEANLKKLRASGYDKPFTSLENAVRDYYQTRQSASQS